MNNCGNCANYDRAQKEHTDVCAKCVTAYVNDERQEPSHWKRIPMTNGDKIRAMTDEELAEWLCDSSDCYLGRCIAFELCRSGVGKANGMKKWLQQPAEDDC